MPYAPSGSSRDRGREEEDFKTSFRYVLQYSTTYGCLIYLPVDGSSTNVSERRSKGIERYGLEIRHNYCSLQSLKLIERPSSSQRGHYLIVTYLVSFWITQC
jgi:hypothetical protein